MNNYFVIENESTSIERIKSVLDNFEDFYCIGNSSDTNIAMNTILKETPSLVFLSVDNVIESPFKFSNSLNQYLDTPPLVIGISSSKTKAYKAIKNNFFDYLLKPLSDLEVRKTILKAKKDNVFKTQNTVCLKSYKDYRYLNTNEILFLKADNNTTDFYMTDGSTISAFKTLKTYENLLPNSFLRIHKSYVINSNYVSGINYGKLMCTINKCGLNIPFTKTYIDNVKVINKTLSQSALTAMN